MFFRVILVQISLLLLLSGCIQTRVPDVYRAKFVVVAVTDNIDDRTEVEDKVSAKLQSNGFDAVASHQLVSGKFRIQDNWIPFYAKKFNDMYYVDFFLTKNRG